MDLLLEYLSDHLYEFPGANDGAGVTHAVLCDAQFQILNEDATQVSPMFTLTDEGMLVEVETGEVVENVLPGHLELVAGPHKTLQLRLGAEGSRMSHTISIQALREDVLEWIVQTSPVGRQMCCDGTLQHPRICASVRCPTAEALAARLDVDEATAKKSALSREAEPLACDLTRTVSPGLVAGIAVGTLLAALLLALAIWAGLSFWGTGGATSSRAFHVHSVPVSTPLVATPARPAPAAVVVRQAQFDTWDSAPFIEL